MNGRNEWGFIFITKEFSNLGLFSFFCVQVTSFYLVYDWWRFILVLAGRLKMFSFYECWIIVNKSIWMRGESKRASGIFSVILLFIVDHFVLRQVEKQVGSKVAVRWSRLYLYIMEISVVMCFGLQVFCCLFFFYGKSDRVKRVWLWSG